MILVNNFPVFSRVEWGASDTETFTYIDDVKVTYDELNRLGRVKDAAFFREHASVRVWAWQFSDGIHMFVSNDFDEYMRFLCEHKVKAVWFYNAKFDFAQIDYQLLTHDPPYTVVDEEKTHSQPWTFSSLHNDKGARFSLKIWTPYKHTGKGSKRVNRHEHVHAVTFYDFCNIFGGGLKRLLEEFNVVDYDNVSIRKSTMDYQNVDELNLTTAELEYLINDTKGLYHLIRIANDTLTELTGFQITGKKPDIMTAGGLAKKVLLSFLYPDIEKPVDRIKAFQDDHPLELIQDEFFRQRKLYTGAVCVLNPRYSGKLLYGGDFKMHRYDVNSEYPFVMSRMKDIYGKPERMTLSQWEHKSKRYKDGHVCIYVFSEFEATVKKDKISVFRNPFTAKYTDYIHIDEIFCMFDEEFEELKQWYDLDVFIRYVITFKTRDVDGYRAFVDKFFTLKNESKKSGDKAKTAFAKLLLNSAYGKLAERVKREKTYRAIKEADNAVRLIHTEEFEVDERGRLSVVQGAYITMRARVWILSHIREICPNVAEQFIYCDTDSVHTMTAYKNADAYMLGGFKDEGVFNCVKYIAPKCYFDAIIDGKVVKDIEFHTKGLNVQVIRDEFTIINDDRRRWKDIDEIARRFSYGEKYQSLSGMNIRGGKALIPLEKYIAQPIANFNYQDGIYIED